MITVEVSEMEAKMVAGALRSGYTELLDAIGYCAGAPYGYTRPRTEPRDITGHLEKLDSIERICQELGFPLNTISRRDTLSYYSKQKEIWRSEHPKTRTLAEIFPETADDKPFASTEEATNFLLSLLKK